MPRSVFGRNLDDHFMLDILVTLIACALRRGRRVRLTVGDLEQRDGRAVFVDIAGRGGRVRTVPVPD